MAPPKRKTGGRVTAPGTKPSSTSRAGTATSSTRSHESGRYTAPTPQSMQESPAWVPVLMLGFFLVGAVAIMARYLWWDSNIPLVTGMALLLAGLFTATRWR